MLRPHEGSETESQGEGAAQEKGLFAGRTGGVASRHPGQGPFPSRLSSFQVGRTLHSLWLAALEGRFRLRGVKDAELGSTRSHPTSLASNLVAH